MMFPSKEQVEKIRQEYPVGTKVQLISMDDPHAVPPGTVGEVELVDDAGNIHTRWADGRRLAFIPEVDTVRKL